MKLGGLIRLANFDAIFFTVDVVHNIVCVRVCVCACVYVCVCVCVCVY